ncbi:hypothetical protein [Sphingorhabdus sp.]|uniref:hypothetical protein n=1 Tax=Sphingorhabdus sp. TaxID=1902408 RepID=UPI0035B14086|nr:hypothetical protein [Sphingomonadaceae bacterium]
MVKLTDGVDAEVRRGSESWTYIYVTLGFMLTIEAGIIALITPLAFPRNLIVYSAAGTFTIYLWLFSGWFQNKLIGWKSRYELKARRSNFVPTLVVALVILIISMFILYYV